MKRFFKITGLAVALMLFNANRNTASAQISASISFQTFYDDLSPYGRWIDYPQYGYVWSFEGGSDFRPYSTMGHWEWSDDYDWIWVSDYDWGWAPFHYGRWFFDPAYGWLWAPGYDWSPAWVAWRSGGDYYGWAPLNPGISINFSISNYAPPVDYWCFAPRRYITSPRIYDYCLNSRQNFAIVNNTTIINNYNFYGGRERNVFVNGPGRFEVEGYTHERIRPVSFRESSRPGATQFRNNEIAMYRPNVQRDGDRRFSPGNFDRYNNRPQNNNGFGREDNRNNGFRRNDNRDNRSNNLPIRRDDNNNTMGDRNYNGNNNDRQNRNDRNVFDQKKNDQPFQNNRQPVTNNPFQRNNKPLNQNNNRGFDRRNWGGQNNNQPQIERRQVEQPRQFDRRNDNGSNRDGGSRWQNNGGNNNGNGRGNVRGRKG
ncbi:MAG TPA: DUF6600 domain-containing protein [Chitinophagaceae bacterium]|nr:DUF6600 domain-containing protein [Chitinophagaceae bacterium]